MRLLRGGGDGQHQNAAFVRRPATIKLPLLGIRTVVSITGFCPWVKRTFTEIRFSLNSCGVTAKERPPGISKTFSPCQGTV